MDHATNIFYYSKKNKHFLLLLFSQKMVWFWILSCVFFLSANNNYPMSISTLNIEWQCYQFWVSIARPNQYVKHIQIRCIQNSATATYIMHRRLPESTFFISGKKKMTRNRALKVQFLDDQKHPNMFFVLEVFIEKHLKKKNLFKTKVDEHSYMPETCTMIWP